MIVRPERRVRLGFWNRAWAELSTALAFLTIIPIPAPTFPSSSNRGESSPPSGNARGRAGGSRTGRVVAWFPVVGLVIGTLLMAWELATRSVVPDPVRAVVSVILSTIISGGIHLDGLMDTADGLFSGRDRARALQIMRDSRVGAMGVLAAIFSVLLKWSLILSTPSRARPFALLVMPVMGRWSMCAAVHAFPYARPGGGLGKSFARSTSRGDLAFATATAVGPAVMLAFLLDPRFLAMFFVTAPLSLAASRAISRKLGGLTGDVYGAINELSEILALLAITIPA